MADKAGKITVIGAGTIGPTVAYALMLKELTSEIVLINRETERAGWNMRLGNVFLSVPVHLGKRGVERIAVIDLSNEEQKLLVKSSEILAGYVQEAGDIL